MIVFLDDDFRCHLSDGGGMRPVETDVFIGGCAEYIEGYRFIPAGESWTRKDGVVFRGEMIAPAEDYNLLKRFQAQHEADEAAHLEELGALIEEIYSEDLEVIG